MKARATINEVYVLIEINHGLVDDLERSIFGNLKGIRDADAQGALALLT
jgi:hypothetical protein